MKRLAAVALVLAWFCCGALAQGVGSHGGFSGSRRGFSAPAGGFSSHSAPAFHGGFSAPRSGLSRPAPPRYMGPSHFAPRPTSYPVRGPRPVTTGPRMPYGSSMHRAPYHSPYGGSRRHDGYRHPRNRVVFVSGVGPVWGLGYPYDGGYPYPSGFLDDPDSYDSQTASNYAASEPADYNNEPYQAQPTDEQGPGPSEPYAQPPSTVERVPYGGVRSTPPSPDAPVTLVFKDGRPPEQIHNYLVTASTLTVLDQRSRDIPVDQIDLNATARVNLQAGVEFSLPGQRN